MNEGLHHEVADLLLGRNGGPTTGTGFAVGPLPVLNAGRACRTSAL